MIGAKVKLFDPIPPAPSVAGKTFRDLHRVNARFTQQRDARDRLQLGRVRYIAYLPVLHGAL